MYTNKDRVCPVCQRVVGRDYIVDLKRALVYHIACIEFQDEIKVDTEAQHESPLIH